MLNQIVSTIEEAHELPVVKRLYKSRFVSGQIQSLENFLGRLVKKNVEKVISPALKYSKLLNIILINLVILSYFAGKANSQSIADWKVVFENYSVIAAYTIIANVIAVFFIGIKEVLILTARILLMFSALFIAGFLIYRLIKGIRDYYNNFKE